MSLLRKGILAGGGTIICTTIGVATNMMLARALLPEGMGRYQLPLTTVALVVTLLSLGIGNANIYFLNKHKIEPQRIVMNSIWAGLFASALLLVALPIIFTVFENYFGELNLWVKVFFSLGACAMFNTTLVKPVLSAALQIREVVYSQVVSMALMLVVVAVCFVFNVLTLNVALSVLAISYLCAFAIQVFYIRDKVNFNVPFSWSLFKQTLGYGLKLYASNIVYLVNFSIGLMLLRYLMPGDFANIGYYGRATALCKLIMLIPIALGPLLYAKWAGIEEEQRRQQVPLAIRLHLILGVLILCIIQTAGYWIIVFLYSREFLPALPAMRILAFGVALRCTLTVCINLFASDGRAHITAYIMTFSLIVIVILTWVLVPYYGINGAAIADVFASGLVFGIALFILKHLYGIKLHYLIVPKRSDLDYLINSIRKKKPAEGRSERNL